MTSSISQLPRGDDEIIDTVGGAGGRGGASLWKLYIITIPALGTTWLVSQSLSTKGINNSSAAVAETRGANV